MYLVGNIVYGMSREDQVYLVDRHVSRLNRLCLITSFHKSISPRPTLHIPLPRSCSPHSLPLVYLSPPLVLLLSISSIPISSSPSLTPSPPTLSPVSSLLFNFHLSITPPSSSSIKCMLIRTTLSPKIIGLDWYYLQYPVDQHVHQLITTSPQPLYGLYKMPA